MANQEWKLDRLEKNLRELARFQNTTGAHPDDWEVRWGRRYGMLETVQVAIDLACGIVRRRNYGSPDRPAECFRLLQQDGVLSEGVGERLMHVIDARDEMRTSGQEVDDAFVLDALDRLADFRMFARDIRETTSSAETAS